MYLYKNVADQKLTVVALNSATGAPVTGDAANIAAEISKDGGPLTAINEAHPTELDAINQPGVYLFDLTQAETNAGVIVFRAFSSTPLVEFDLLVFYPAQPPVTTVIGRFDDEDAASPNVTWFVGETSKPKSVTCVNTANEPIDLTAYGAFHLVIERLHRRADVQVIEHEHLSIDGVDHNVLTFQADSSVLSHPGEFAWSARQSDNSRIAGGRITVRYAPLRDA